MRIGIDFDNTLVCYDQLFWKLAYDHGLIEASLPQRKDAVRDHLRQRRQEPIWTEMQGVAYGPRILDAQPFPGAIEAIREFCQRGWTSFVVSHKTRQPFAGPAFDLHAAASQWLNQYRFVTSESTGLTAESVYLELTKQSKLHRIADLECDWFIDDLPELLTDPQFPSSVKRILFDPHQQHSAIPDIQIVHDWNHVVAFLTQTEVAS